MTDVVTASSAAIIQVETIGPQTRSRTWLVFGCSWILLSMLVICWSIATPVSASPDEPAHIVKAASVVRGQFLGTPSALGHVVRVPRSIASTHAETCFAFRPDISADCATPLAGAPGEMIDSTTTAGLYDPVYYALVGWPSLIFDDVTAIYAMRILSSILTALFLAFTISIAYGWKRNALPLMSLALASPPMLLFLGGSVNPNAVETTATLAAFAAMLGLTIFPDSRLILARSAILLAGVAVAVTSRGLSPLWLAIAVLLPLLLSNWSHIRALMREVPVRCAIAGATIATVFALLWTFATNSLAGASASSSFSFPGVGSTPFAGFLNTVRDTFGYAQGMIGNFGWLDTPAPLGVYFVWSALVGSLLLTAFTVLRGRPLFFVAALFVLVVVLPALIQGAYVTSGGIIWQGRYTLPLFSIAVFGTAALTAQHTRVVSSASWSRFGFLIWLVCAAAQFASFATALRRYAVGANGTWPNTFFYPAWTAPGGNILWVAVFTLVLAATTFLAWRLSTSSDFSTRQRQRLA